MKVNQEKLVKILENGASNPAEAKYLAGALNTLILKDIRKEIVNRIRLIISMVLEFILTFIIVPYVGEKLGVNTSFILVYYVVATIIMAAGWKIIATRINSLTPYVHSRVVFTGNHVGNDNARFFMKKFPLGLNALLILIDNKNVVEETGFLKQFSEYTIDSLPDIGKLAFGLTVSQHMQLIPGTKDVLRKYI